MHYKFLLVKCMITKSQRKLSFAGEKLVNKFIISYLPEFTKTTQPTPEGSLEM